MSKTEDYQSLSRELDEILDKLQREDINIDEAVQAYARGMEIVEKLQAQLKSAENKVRQVKADWEAKAAKE
jgi:exodeoxyribonuclease VII small subunit